MRSGKSSSPELALIPANINRSALGGSVPPPQAAVAMAMVPVTRFTQSTFAWSVTVSVKERKGGRDAGKGVVESTIGVEAANRNPSGCQSLRMLERMHGALGIGLCHSTINRFGSFLNLFPEEC